VGRKLEELERMKIIKIGKENTTRIVGKTEIYITISI